MDWLPSASLDGQRSLLDLVTSQQSSTREFTALPQLITAFAVREVVHPQLCGGTPDAALQKWRQPARHLKAGPFGVRDGRFGDHCSGAIIRTETEPCGDARRQPGCGVPVSLELVRVVGDGYQGSTHTLTAGSGRVVGLDRA
jgi:hypothetical protein